MKILISFLFFLFCSTGFSQSIKDGNANALTFISEEQAIEIAFDETGWPRDDVSYVSSDFYSDKDSETGEVEEGWIIFIHGKEPIVGNHCGVMISKDGKVIDILGGR